MRSAHLVCLESTRTRQAVQNVYRVKQVNTPLQLGPARPLRVRNANAASTPTLWLLRITLAKIALQESTHLALEMDMEVPAYLVPWVRTIRWEASA